MNKNVKFTQQEMDEIKTLQGKFQAKVFEFGQFRLERMRLLSLVKDLEGRESKAEEEFKSFQAMETSLLESLTKKYGEGSLNLQDGTFIPTPSPTQPPVSG